MQITRISELTGKTHTREIPVTIAELRHGYDKIYGGAYIQDAFPQLSADDREFLKTGITSEEWDSIFPEEE